MAMRVLLLTPGFPPLLGGGERYAHELAQQLAQRGHEVTVVTSAARRGVDLYRGAAPDGSGVEIADGLGVVRLALRPMPGGRAGLLAWRKAMVVLSQLPGDQSVLLRRMARWVPPLVGLEEALADLGPHDLVHVLNLSWEWPAVAGWRYARSRGLPLVVTPFLHLGRGRASREALNSGMDHQRRLLHEAQAVLALTAVEAEQCHALGATAERVHVVGAGWSASMPIQPLEPSTLGALPRPYALFIGRLSRDKGVFVAVQAARLLRDQGRGLSLVLVGERAPEFVRWERRHGRREEGVVVLGRVEEDVKQALLAQAEFLLLPSVVESFGLVFLEAWSHGKAVVGVRAGGVPGVVRHGENGLLAPPNDARALAAAITQLLDDPALAQRLGEAGRTGLAEHTWDRVYARTLEAYQAALARMEG